MSTRASAVTLIGKRYHIVDKLGEGGMGAVFRAHDRLTGQQVALKRLLTDPSNLQHNSRADTSTSPLMTLANEFRTLSSLRHPHIISVLDYGFESVDEQRSPFFTMLLLDEPQTIVEAARDLPLETQIDYVTQMLLALAYLHRRGIIHRDLKPGNVLVKDEHVYVLDFGLAVDQDKQDGNTVGTLSYIAPEVLQGTPASVLSDLYTVGVIAAEIIGGAHPYEGGSVNDIINNILFNPVDLSDLDIGEALADVLYKLLAKDPAERYDSALIALAELCDAVGLSIPEETRSIQDSFLQSAKFVGRVIEREMLKGAFDHMLDEGQGSAWLIGGESGVGKSRLMEEIRTQAMVKGALVLHGQALSGGGLLYQMWRGVLRRLALNIALPDDEAILLKALVHDLDQIIGRQLPEATDLGQSNNQRLLMIIGDMFRQVAVEQPILLLLEDLHWSNESLQVLENLIKSVSTIPLMIIGNFRSDEAPQLAEKLPEMQFIQLDRLQQYEIAELSESMLGQAGTRPHVVSVLQNESEGNVFFLIEVVRALAEDAGRLSDIGSVTLPNQIFAGGVRRVVQRRLRQLPAWARPAVRVAAVIDRYVDRELIARLDPALDLEAWITVTVNAAVFDIREDRVRFAHDKLREAVLEDLEADEHAGIHRQVAEAIERLHMDDIEKYASVLQHHWQQAGDHEKESAYILVAAHRFSDATAQHREALRLYERALAIDVPSYTDDPTRTLSRIRQGMAQAHYGLADYEKARELAHTALEGFQQVGDERGIADAYTTLGESDFRQGKFDLARVWVEKSIAIYKQLDIPLRIATSNMNLGVIEAQTGNVKASREINRKALAILRDLDEPLNMARILNNLGITNEMLGERDVARKCYNESLAIRRRIKDRQGIAYSLSNLSYVTESEGDIDSTRRLRLEALQILRQLGDSFALASGLNGLGILERDLGNYVQAETYLRESLEVSQRTGVTPNIIQAYSNLGALERLQDNLSEARAMLRQSLATAVEAGVVNNYMGPLIHFVDLLNDEGHPIEAITLLVFVRQYLLSQGQPAEKLTEKLDDFRATFSEALFDAAVERGESLTPDEAVALTQLAG